MKPAADFYTSYLSRYCAEHLPGDFHFLDGDEVLLRYSAQPIVYARATRILRLLESKFPGEEVRRSQRDLLPIFAEVIRVGVESEVLHERSGVFVIEADWKDEDPESFEVNKVIPAVRIAGLTFEKTITFQKDNFARFLRCR
jgi:hypothetical protein